MYNRSYGVQKMLNYKNLPISVYISLQMINRLGKILLLLAIGIIGYVLADYEEVTSQSKYNTLR